MSFSSIAAMLSAAQERKQPLYAVIRAFENTRVVIIYRHTQRNLRAILSDDILIERFFQLTRCRKLLRTRCSLHHGHCCRITPPVLRAVHAG